MAALGNFINGVDTPSASERTSPVYNPATGQVQYQLPLSTTAEVTAAIDAAAAAAPGWRATSLSKRTNIFFNFRQLVAQNRDKIAALVTSEHGKVLGDADGEVARGLENIEYAAGLIEQLKGEFAEQVATGVDVHSVKQPVGVVGCITPFNFPVMVPLWMMSSAIACGNTVVIKPSEKDPSAVRFIADLFQQAGLPDGVLNVVNGDKEAVDTILDSPTVRAVSFVGSTPIARSIYQRASLNGKRVQALGGAKNHMVVLPDADIAAAADAAVSAAYGSAGERCMAVSVLVAVDGIGDQLVKAIEERIAKLGIGDGTKPDSEMGPLITGEHRDKVASYVKGAPGEGASVVVDGTVDEMAGGQGFFLGVSLIDNVKPDMKVYQDEIFGPVLSVVRVDTFEEAVQLVNENQYGNGVALFTRDGGAARQFEFEIQAGMVGINVPIPVPIGSFSFGGWKDSLFGDAHMYGPESFHFYTRSKVVTSRWPDPATSSVDLGFPSNS